MAEDIKWLDQRINGSGAPVIIDGGMGTELEKSGVPMDGKVWSGKAVLTHPDAVRTVHQEFISAGAEVIIANTFAAARHMLEPGGLGDNVAEINSNAVRLACEARDNSARGPVAVAGSICEWAPTEDTAWHSVDAVGRSCREQADLLAEAGADLLALEMCQDTVFSIAAVEAAQETGLPVWIGTSAQSHKGSDSLSVFDYENRDFHSLVEALAGFPAMIMNIMHTPVSDVDSAIATTRKNWNGPIGVYPESGYFTMPNWQFVDVISEQELVDHAQRWVDDGVRLVGGCCGLGPGHIAALRQAFG